MSKEKGWGWNSFKPTDDDSLWAIHDHLVEQGDHQGAHAVVTAIGMCECDLIKPNFAHRRVYATRRPKQTCTSSQ